MTAKTTPTSNAQPMDNHLTAVSHTNSGNSGLDALNNLYPEALLEPNKGLNIKDFWNVIARNKKMLLGITLAAFLLSLLLSLLMPAVYRATTTIQIERQSTSAADVILEPSKQRNERDYWQTQIQLLQSNTLALAVMDKLGVKDKFTSKKGFLSFLRSSPPTPESNFLKALTVEPLANSQLVMIHFESKDPELSRDIVNTIADTYIQTNLKRQLDNAQYTETFLQSQLSQARANMLDAEKKLDQYAREHKIVSLDDTQTTTTHTLKKLSDELASAERSRAQLEEEVAQLSKAASLDSVPVTLDTPYMNKLQTLQEQYATAKKKYGSRSRKARRLKKEIEDLKTTIKTRLAEAKQDEQALKKRLDKLKEQSLAAQEETHTFNKLKREVKAKRAIYENLLARIKEVGIAAGIEGNNITVIDKASTPHNKFKPKVKTNVALGTLIGLFLGIAAIFLREFMDDSIKDSDELERITHLPVLGMIPEHKGQTGAAIATQIIREPRSHISEAIRSLRTALSFSTQDGAPHTLFLTSSEPGEGKTSIAVNLAMAYALAGENVLLIDADLRNPSVHSILKLDNRLGLSNYLTGSADFSSTTQTTSVAGLRVLTSGPLPPDPVELLSGRRIKDLISKSKAEYDRIIIDGPPVLGLADALILGHIADATLVTIHSESTRKADILASLKRLKQAKAHVIGTLMNQISEATGYKYLHYEQKNVATSQDDSVLNMFEKKT